jgi:hypothetical protein
VPDLLPHGIKAQASKIREYRDVAIETFEIYLEKSIRIIFSKDALNPLLSTVQKKSAFLEYPDLDAPTAISL